MRTLIFDRRNISLEYENNCLLVRQPDLPPRTIPLTHISKVVCLHSVQVTTSLLGQLWERKIAFITLNNRYSERSFALFPNQQKMVERRCMQYHWQLKNAQALELSKKLCQHRLRCNMRIVSTQSKPLINTLESGLAAISDCYDINRLRGIEGSCQRAMFDYWRGQISPELGFERRQRRPPTDPVNAVLSLTYTLVLQEAIRQCTAWGLDAQLGFYHAVAHGRYSLACDIMEPVRPFCEQWVFLLFADKKLNKTHFSRNKTNQACYLGKQGREVFYHAIDEVLLIWERKLKAVARWLTHVIDNPENMEKSYGLVSGSI